METIRNFFQNPWVQGNENEVGEDVTTCENSNFSNSNYVYFMWWNGWSRVLVLHTKLVWICMCMWICVMNVDWFFMWCRVPMILVTISDCDAMIMVTLMKKKDTHKNVSADVHGRVDLSGDLPYNWNKFIPLCTLLIFFFLHLSLCT